MSVINKMLRDLDQRHAPEDQAQPRHSAARLRSGTASLAQAMPSARRRLSPGLQVGGVLGLVVLMSGVWWALAGRSAKPAAQPLVPLAATPSVVAEPALLVPHVAPVLAKAVPTAVKATSALIIRAVPAPMPAAMPMVASAQVAAVRASVPVVAAPVVAADAQGLSQRQQQAAKDAMAQAQMLWSAGSHEAATELLHQAVGMSEHNASSSPSTANTQTLASLARELARMQLADGHAAAAADLLGRLQPQLEQEPDIWALRANAAQRLGRHQESVSDYTTALQLRPNEQRWLLGAAVSLAAQGQTANAAAMAERARAVGPVAREVQAYLRQMGVQIKEP